MPFNLDPHNMPLPHHLPVIDAVERWLRFLDTRAMLPQTIDLDRSLFASVSKGGYGIDRRKVRSHIARLDHEVRTVAGFHRPSGTITYLQVRGALPNGTPAVNSARDLISVCCN